MTTQNNKYQALIILATAVLISFIAYGLLFLLPKPVDDIPWAQGFSEPSVEAWSDMMYLLRKFITLIGIVTIIQLFIFKVSQILGIYSTTNLILFGITAVFTGLLVQLSSLGNSIVWFFIIHLHLKRYGWENLTLYMNVIETILILALGLLVAFCLIMIQLSISKSKVIALS